MLVTAGDIAANRGDIMFCMFCVFCVLCKYDGAVDEKL
jgi:hypothetical protein